MMTLLLRIASALDVYSALNIADADAFFSCIVQIVIFGLLPISLYALTNRGGVRKLALDFGVKRVRPKSALLILPLAVCMIIVGSGVSYVWQLMLVILGFTHVSSPTDYSSIAVLFKQLALVALLPSIFEEIAHRGLIYAGYRELGYKFCFVSALLFSLMHQNIVQTGYTFTDGLVMALAMYYTGSVFPGIFIHFLNNAYSCVSEYVAQNGGPLSFMNVAADWLDGTSTGRIVSALAFVAAAALVALIMIALRKQALKDGNISGPAFSTPKDERPLYKDAPFIATVAIGVGATVFSLIWGLTR